MFASAPILVLERKVLNRLLVCLFLLPLTLVFAWGIYASLQPPPDRTSATLDAALGLLCGVTSQPSTPQGKLPLPQRSLPPRGERNGGPGKVFDPPVLVKSAGFERRGEHR